MEKSLHFSDTLHKVEVASNSTVAEGNKTSIVQREIWPPLPSPLPAQHMVGHVLPPFGPASGGMHTSPQPHPGRTAPTSVPLSYRPAEVGCPSPPHRLYPQPGQGFPHPSSHTSREACRHADVSLADNPRETDKKDWRRNDQAEGIFNVLPLEEETRASAFH